MNQRQCLSGLGTLVLVAAFSCHSNTVDKAEFKSALDAYYSSRQACLFNPEIKLPAQADTGDQEQTKGFDALTDAGLLLRTPEEKKRFLIGSKQVNDYDLTAQGRPHWTADANQPGFGNFCAGSPTVWSIDNFVSAEGGQSQYTVTYTYGLNLPDWANTGEIRTAFPRIAEATAGQSSTATLTRGANGWQVSNVASARTAPLPQ